MQGNSQDFSLHQNRLLLVFPSPCFRPCRRLLYLQPKHLFLCCNLRHFVRTMQDCFCYELFLLQGLAFRLLRQEQLRRQLYHFLESYLQIKLFRLLRQSLLLHICCNQLHCYLFLMNQQQIRFMTKDLNILQLQMPLPLRQVRQTICVFHKYLYQ